jgi:hypothetical protein
LASQKYLEIGENSMQASTRSQNLMEFDQTKNQRKLVSDELIKAKLIDEDPDFEGSELRED